MTVPNPAPLAAAVDALAAYSASVWGKPATDEERAEFAGMAHVATPAALRAAADLIEARYPTDVWPEDSQHPESRVAAGARLACKQLRHEADQIERASYTPAEAREANDG